MKFKEYETKVLTNEERIEEIENLLEYIQKANKENDKKYIENPIKLINEYEMKLWESNIFKEKNLQALKKENTKILWEKEENIRRYNESQEEYNQNIGNYNQSIDQNKQIIDEIQRIPNYIERLYNESI